MRAVVEYAITRAIEAYQNHNKHDLEAGDTSG